MSQRPPYDYFADLDRGVHHPALALPAPEVERIARDLGFAGRLRGLGSQQDQNAIVEGHDGEGPILLKLANPMFPARDSEAQDEAAEAVAAAWPELRVARVVPSDDGTPRRSVVATSAGRIVVRALEFLPGGTLVDRGYLGSEVAARMGRIAGQVSVALADFDHPGLERALEWDLRVADRVVEALAEGPDAVELLAASCAAAERLASLRDRLVVQPGHFDLTDDNLVAGPDGLPDGVIDFGDLSRSWRVAELAVTITGLLHHPGVSVAHVLAAVRAFVAVQPLSVDEVSALWPLVVLRGAVLVVCGRHQVALDAGGNAYAEAALEREWAIFHAAATGLESGARDVGVACDVMTANLRASLDGPTAGSDHSPSGAVVPLLEVTPTELDLSVTSRSLDDGAWLESDCADRLAADILEGGAPAVAARWAQPRLSESQVLSPDAPATIPTSLTLWAPAGTSLRAPWDGVADGEEGLVRVVRSDGVRLVLHGVAPRREGVVQAGDVLGEVSGTRLEVQVMVGDAVVPLRVTPQHAPGWLALTRDPATLVGLSPATGPTPPRAAVAALARRDAHVAGVQEHYYADPPQVERGWRATLIDTNGRSYLDMVNNVTSVGHAHPRLRAVAERQLALLNTNSRFHYAALGEFAQVLADRLPDGLDQVFLVNSGSEAVDLAIRLAMAATGRRDVVALAEAYHGWTYASDAVSTSTADNPNALATRPDWVRTVPAPNSYRGRWRDGEAWRYGPDAAERIAALAAAGHLPAAFIAEAIGGNSGGIVAPDGYLAQVYRAVRAAGGLAIADEVQVGYGRLGEWFWGFQQQGVVPDIVAVAKSMGSGYPLGAVITTRPIAEAYREGGYFFSSTGGSPLGCAMGLEVLRIIDDEALQANAARVGTRLADGLRALGERYPAVGTVHGHGLYLGLELVADRELRTPDAALTRALCDRLLDLGVIMQPTGDHGNVLKIKPPLVLQEREADFFVEMVDRALGELTQPVAGPDRG